ncbi:phospholipid scramblase 1 [Bombyx mori]|uniref:Phospholipid scramblase n=1 Tax=Bombyx mori TaxID=7091 RepID=A0A8R1WJF9_BOMMO|nr:phospholipid scramblase 1 [Bombyx mori]XP_004930222.1 phospholipid scramblase 1 [Bombyx mori]
MSHKPTPYSPNFPASHGYVPPPEGEKPNESYPMHPQSGYPGPPPTPMPHPGLHPGAQPLPGMQHGFQPGFQPGYQPGFAPGYPQPSGYPVPVMQQPGPQAPGGWMNMPQGLSNCPRGLEYLSMIDQLIMHQKVELLEAFVGFETNNKYTVMNSVGQKVYYAIEDNDCCTRNCCGPLRPFDMKIMDNFNNEVYSKDGETKVGKITKSWSGFAREAFTDADNFGISFPMDLDVKIKAVLLGACFLIDFMFFEKGNNNRN